MTAALGARTGLRPLDRFGSLKIKLGILIVVAVSLATVLAAGGVKLGWWPRYTIPIAVALALLVTQILARGMTAPLREMTAAARAMQRGDYSRRVTDTSADEVGDLARAFNTMAERLGQVEQQRRELVANVSHELRTPISGLRALLENLVDGVTPPDPQALQSALAQADRLSRLVGDLLDLSRVDAGILRLHREEVAVAELYAAAVAEAAIPDPPVRLVTEVSPPDLVVTGDRARLQQLVANLVDNAVRHSGASGTVTLRGGADVAGRVVLDVLDEGPGIPTAQRQAVFERFTTGGQARDGSTGLGLAIARWVVQLHGGTIAVADSDRGCDLRVTLPGRAEEPT